MHHKHDWWGVPPGVGSVGGGTWEAWETWEVGRGRRGKCETPCLAGTRLSDSNLGEMINFPRLRLRCGISCVCAYESILADSFEVVITNEFPTSGPSYSRADMPKMVWNWLVWNAFHPVLQISLIKHATIPIR